MAETHSPETLPVARGAVLGRGAGATGPTIEG
jgi:hypothetical protein